MCFSNADLDFFMDNIRIQMCGRDIKNVKSGKHLGHIISSRGSLVNFEPVIRDMKVRTNVIINQFCSTSWQSKVVLFNSQCVSLYGCQPWSLDDPRIEELCVARRVCCCRLLGQHSRTCSYLLPHIMDSPPIRHNVAKRTLIFFHQWFESSCTTNITLFQKCLTFVLVIYVIECKLYIAALRY